MLWLKTWFISAQQNIQLSSKLVQISAIYTGSRSRAGHVPTFLKSFRSVLERGASAWSFRSRSFFLSFRSRSVPSRSVPFWVEERPSRSVPFLAFLFKERFHPSRSVLSQRKLVILNLKKFVTSSNFLIPISLQPMV